MLVAVYKINETGSSEWLCMCDCGQECTVFGAYLRVGQNKSCGCMRYTKESQGRKALAFSATSARSRPSVLGKRFGRLVVIGEDLTKMRQCRCDCGKITSVRNSQLLSGDVRSCGCLATDNARIQSERIARAARLEAGVPLDAPVSLRPRAKESRKHILVRDGGCCVLCRSSSDLQVHHVKKWASHPELRCDPLNLVTLCKPCHVDKAHGGNTHRLPDPEIAEVLNRYLYTLYIGVLMEKTGNMVFTKEEIESILSGVIPDRIVQCWPGVTLTTLVEIINTQITNGEYQ